MIPRREFLLGTAIFGLLGLRPKAVGGTLSTAKKSSDYVPALISNEYLLNKEQVAKYAGKLESLNKEPDSAIAWQFKEIEKWHKHYKGDLFIVFDKEDPWYDTYQYLKKLNATIEYCQSGIGLTSKIVLTSYRTIYIYHISERRDIQLTRSDSFIGWDESGVSTYQEIIKAFWQKPPVYSTSESISYCGSPKLYKGPYDQMQIVWII